MTPAERQQRRRKRLAKEDKVALRKKAQITARQKIEKAYSPAPPGVTYWRTITRANEDGTERKVHVPVEKPYPSVHWAHLDDDDLMCLLRQTTREAIKRRLLEPGEPVHVVWYGSVGDEVNAGLGQLVEGPWRELEPGEWRYVGPLPAPKVETTTRQWSKERDSPFGDKSPSRKP